ncbi:MAG: putative 40S ribosomal protein S10b [Streblomastix strix]|uniref:Putative 40S ribosomal protein S10b n=1 Tax=Streblomastix strix TaxID=222440 RepID=A0A5J4VVY3_9EUKA|nr:MAG: putative 40S ribosomal protein S10b [Streblomastix strix]
MLIPTPDRLAILRYFFQEGVILAEKEFFKPKNIVLPKIQNIYVIKLMQSLVTRKYAKETFNWQVYYWTLTNEGIVYLREYLHLGDNVVPATQKATKPVQAFPDDQRRDRRDYRQRDDYRRTDYRKEAGDFKPTFNREGGPQRRPYSQ